MRKLVIVFIALAIQINLYAQVYYPEGTKWTEIRLDTLKYDNWYSKVGDEWVPNFETVEYYVKGEYKDKYWDNPFKCVYTNGFDWTDSLSLMIYEGRYNCVMATIPVFYDDILDVGPGTAYQFGWTIGVNLQYQNIIDSNCDCFPPRGRYNYGTIEEIKEGFFGGVRTMKYTDVNGVRIIQGIGVTTWNDGECIFGPVDPYGAHSIVVEQSFPPQRLYRSMLVYFERDGEVLYDVWPDRVSSVNNVPSVAPQQDGPIYDLSGRKVNSQFSYSLPTRESQGGSLRKGLYIQNGKKVAVR